MATITANGCKFSFQILAKGLTERVYTTHIGDISGAWRDHTESGWQTSEIFITYLIHLGEYMGPSPIALVLDSYAAHRTWDAKQTTAELGIDLHFIFPGLTDQFLPLERSVFAILKAHIKKLFHDRVSEDPFLVRSKQEAIADLIAAWKSVGSYIIQEG
jgi:hypothetical protein